MSRRKKILIIGAGGIGSFLVQFLNKLNIYELTVFDSDKVEEKNLLYQNFNRFCLLYTSPSPRDS